MGKPRLYLFHGNDSRASSVELKRWVEVFLAKYGNATQHIVHADELSFEEVMQRLQQALQTQSLFPEPRFIVMKRLSNGMSPTRIKEIVKVVGTQLAGLTDQVTLVFWEDRLMPANHALHTWFLEHAEKKQAEVKVYKVGTSRALIDGITNRKGKALSPEGDRWLEQHARRMEREQRIAAKLRTGDEIASDWRVWVLENVVEAAGLLAAGGSIEQHHLEQAAGVVTEAVSPFEIINAVQSNDWKRARKLVRQWDQGDEGAYFGLVALLRNYFRRPASYTQTALHDYALELLAEIEILSKNVTARQAWLVDLFFVRCEQFKGAGLPLVQPRRLWLSHVQRVE